MNMRKTIISCLVLLITLPKLFAQNGTGKISGIITDAANKPLSSVTVSLVRSADKTQVKNVISGKDGKYEFVNVAEGEYVVAATSVGHEKMQSSLVVINASNNAVLVPGLQLTEVAKGLTNVTVTSKKPFIETRIDKTIVNVEASPTSACASALEILEKSPGVTVDNDGNISLKGKQGVIVMMDGKPTYLSPTDLANFLKNTPASALETIEIMTNPSAKYDASGNSGVINIKTKKGKNAGFNGSVMVGFTTSIYQPRTAVYFIPKSQNSFNFNWRKGKVNFFGNYNPNYFRGRNTMNFENRFLDNDKNITGYNVTETRFKFGNNNHTLKLGMDWYADKKNTYGVVLQGFNFSGHPTPTTVAELLDENRVLQSRLNSSTDNKIKFRNFSVNLNWKHVFDTSGKELTADLDYVTYSNVSDMTLQTDYYNNMLQWTGTSYLRGHLPANINIYTLKADYLQPFKGGRFEAGIKLSLVKNDNMVNYERLINSKWETDQIRSNHFIYDENINAAYVSISKELKKWSFQAGLRVENTNAKGNQVVTNTTFSRDNTSLFPTAFVRRNLDAKNSLTLSYGRRIQRPNYQDLNPFVYFLDTLSYRQGNIYLKPQYTHNIELTHAFKDKFITTINYNHTGDVISQIIKPEPNSKIRFLTVDNVAQFRNMGIAITAPIPVAKWWNINLFTNLFNNRYKGTYDTIAIDLAFTSFLVNITNSFTIAKGFTGESTGFYRHKAINNLSKVEPLYQIGFGLQKQIMKGKGTVRLNVRDPFAWQQFKGVNKYGMIDGDFRSRPDTRQVTGTFTWRFGKNTQQNQQPRRRAGSSQEEQNRVGQGGQ